MRWAVVASTFTEQEIGYFGILLKLLPLRLQIHIIVLKRSTTEANTHTFRWESMHKVGHAGERGDRKLQNNTDHRRQKDKDHSTSEN